MEKHGRKEEATARALACVFQRPRAAKTRNQLRSTNYQGVKDCAAIHIGFHHESTVHCLTHKSLFPHVGSISFHLDALLRGAAGNLFHLLRSSKGQYNEYRQESEFARYAVTQDP
eukprot:5870923-Amphidinium_carterae.1